MSSYWSETVYDEIEREAREHRRRDAPDPTDFGTPTRAEAEADAAIDREVEKRR